ncbi:MAG: hypothetical protein K2X38_17170 [Gemmataceae bacterium]|nr:hypothetical protein [Gemmataceae bacterium]
MSQPASAADLSDLGMDDLDARVRRLEVSVEDLRSLQRARASLTSLDADNAPSPAEVAEVAELQRRVEAVELRIAGVEAVAARLHDAERSLDQLKTEQLPALHERVDAAQAQPKETRSPAAEYAIAAARSVFASSPSEPSPAGPAIGASTSPWLLLDIWGRFRLVFRMFLDRRFRMTWQSRFLMLTVLAMFLTSQWWCMLSMLPLFVGYFVDGALKLMLAFAGYVVLSRELARYQEHLTRQRFG